MSDQPTDAQELGGPSQTGTERAPGSVSSGGFLSPRAIYLLIGGAAIGMIVIMCLIVGLLIALQGS